jgi:hypothetical protein
LKPQTHPNLKNPSEIMEISSLKVYGCYDFKIEKEALLCFLKRFALDANTEYLIGHAAQAFGGSSNDQNDEQEHDQDKEENDQDKEETEEDKDQDKERNANGLTLTTHFALLKTNGKRIRCRNVKVFEFEGKAPALFCSLSAKDWEERTKALQSVDPECLGKLTNVVKERKRKVTEHALEQEEAFQLCMEFVQRAASWKECILNKEHAGALSKKVSFFKKVFEESRKGPSYYIRPLSSFTVDAVTDWSVTWFFVGASGCGKTQFAMAHFKNPLVINRLDGVQLFQAAGVHDGIVFDDIDVNSFKKKAPQLLIDFLEIETDRVVEFDGKQVRLERNTKKIFTHNDPELFNLDHVEDLDTRCAILRRYRSLLFSDKIF